MEILFSWTSLIIIGHIIVIVGVTLRVIMMRLAVGTALAWIFLIFFFALCGRRDVSGARRKTSGPETYPSGGVTLEALQDVVAGITATDAG